MYKKLSASFALLLCACTTDSLPDEEFEGPTTDFPLLGTVPNRPLLPDNKVLTTQENLLKKEHEEATHRHDDFIKSIKN
jgi:hypothetical protein